MQAGPAPDPEFERLLERGRRAYGACRPDEAIAHLEAARACAGDAARLHLIAGIHRRFGRARLTAELLREAIALRPDAVDAHVHLANLVAHDSEDAELRALAALHETISPDERIATGFALGKVYGELGEFARSAAYYAEANRARRQRLDYATATTREHFAYVKALFTPALFARFADAGNTSARPIFIVGMPRSGSTLTEQILASHPAVFGGGEMDVLGRVDKTMRQQSPDGRLGGFLAALAPAALADWAAAYLAPLRPALGDRTRFTDKNLDNFVRIGLIRLLFPRACVIHCSRDPLDTCFSIWRRLFTGDAVPYGYDQTELGQYYRLYADLMAHWDAVLPGFVHRHVYEELIADPEPATRRLLAACGLDWSPRCLDFFRTERGVGTSSAMQVRRPLYADSIGVAEPYRPWLAELAAALG